MPFATMGEEIDAISDSGTEVWVVNFPISRGTSLWPPKMQTPPDSDPKLISRFLGLFHEKGIIVLIYYSLIFTRLLEYLNGSLGDLDFDGIYFDGMNCGASTRALASDVRADVALYAVRRSIAWRLAESCP